MYYYCIAFGTTFKRIHSCASHKTTRCILSGTRVVACLITQNASIGAYPFSPQSIWYRSPLSDVIWNLVGNIPLVARWWCCLFVRSAKTSSTSTHHGGHRPCCIFMLTLYGMCTESYTEAMANGKNKPSQIAVNNKHTLSLTHTYARMKYFSNSKANIWWKMLVILKYNATRRVFTLHSSIHKLTHIAINRVSHISIFVLQHTQFAISLLPSMPASALSAHPHTHSSVYKSTRKCVTQLWTFHHLYTIQRISIILISMWPCIWLRTPHTHTHMLMHPHHIRAYTPEFELFENHLFWFAILLRVARYFHNDSMSKRKSTNRSAVWSISELV